MQKVWRVIETSARDAVRSLLRLIAWRRQPPPPPPKESSDEMSAHDFEVPLRDAIAQRLEAWGPLLVMLLAGLAMLAAAWWLSTS